jgi:hypothetical protein
LVVVQEQDPAGADKAPKVVEVDEHAVKAVVAVDEREVEVPALAEEPWQRRVGPFGVVLYQPIQPGLL